MYLDEPFSAYRRHPWHGLEAAPAACQASGKVWRFAAADKLGTAQLPLLYRRWSTAAKQRVKSKSLGMGKLNTSRIVKQHAGLPQTSIELTAAGYADSLVC
ncbi:hypothetical protein EBU58_09400 [bacterium]|nr:hypothetical protein [bacterium]